MEGFGLDVEHGHLNIADLDAFFVGVDVHGASNRQSGRGSGRGDQFDNGGAPGDLLKL